VGGTAVGFVIKDAQGTKYLLKFDDKRRPEAETAADIIGQRLLWACGYNVPEDAIVYFTRKDLVVADDAKKRDVFGDKSPMSEADLETGLARVDVAADGTFRGLASKYLDGIPIGPISREGVREDDPNDRIPHEWRRELRGAYAIFEWLNHTDLQEDNTLDAWVEDPHRPGVHYVVHHLIDFGKALGVMGELNRWNWVGFTYRIDVSFALRSLLALGLWKRPYEGIRSTDLRGVGLLEVDRFEPGSWRPNSFYWPLEDKDRFDAFWGAKIIIRFTREHIRTAVEQGRLTDVRAVEHLTDVLVGRQRKTARYWFRRVAPLDRFELADGRLCFEDLTVRYELEDVTGTRYDARAYDRDGSATGWTASADVGAAGRVCLDGVAPSRSRDGYTFVRITTRRRGRTLPATQIHLATDPATRALRVIGLWRE
jgi:hypothetical protein